MITRFLLLALLASLPTALRSAVVASWSAASCTVGQSVTALSDSGPFRLNAVPLPVQGQPAAPRCVQSGGARSVEFSGTPQGLIAPFNPALSITENLTVRAKFRVTRPIPSGSSGFRLVELRDGNLNSQVYDLYLENDPNGKLRPVFRVAAGTTLSERDQVIPVRPFTELPISPEAYVDLNTDYELIGSLTYPPSGATGTLRLLLNGKLIALKTTTRRPTLRLDLARNPGVYLGCSLGGSQGFIGTVSEFEIRNDAINGALPKLSSVQNGASFVSAIVSGSFATIKGENLSVEIMDWSSSIAPDGTFPTRLGSVQVRLNGKLAPIHYVSPGQINVIAPNDDALGTVQVEVINPYGSTTTTGTLQRVSPGFFKATEKYPAAVHTDGVYVAPERFFGSTVASREAKSGDIISFFLTGLGATDPPVPANRVFTGVANTVATPRLFLCGAPMEVQFSGISGYVGLYQVNAVVPAGLPDGECEVELQIEGVSTPGRTVVPVKQSLN